MNFHFYHLATGELHASSVSSNCPPAQARAIASRNMPADHARISGNYDRLSQRVDVTAIAIDSKTGAPDPKTLQVIDHKPPSPSVEHEWDPARRRWVMNAAASTKATARAAALVEIARLENSQHRVVREATLGDTAAVKRLIEIDAKIVALRTTLL